MAAAPDSAPIIDLWRVKARRKLDPEVAEWIDEHRETVKYGPALWDFYETVELMDDTAKGYLGLIDRYYLMLMILHRTDMLDHGAKGNRWLFERCREVEAAPDDHLDLWAREHYKSSIITQAGSIQELLRDPEITIAIFSHTKGIARGFLDQIKQDLETKDDLKRIYSDVLWADPKKEAPRWSLDRGIVVKRKTNPVEATIEGWGLVDGMPTSRHYKLRIYNDVWVQESVTSPEMIQKTQKSRELSENLGMKGGREQNEGTRYHFGDGYHTMIERGITIPRLYPATHDGTLNGDPVFLTPAEWEDKKRKQPSQVAAQMLQNPLAGQDQMFDPEWFKGYWCRPRTLNVYIMGDPSKGTPSRRSDRFGLAVIGVDAGENKYLLDGFRHRMDPTERWNAIKAMHKKWANAPGVMTVSVGYEQYGMLNDIHTFEERMRQENYVFTIQELNWTRDHTRSKEDRVERLVPNVKNGDFFFPLAVWRGNELQTWSVRPQSDEDDDDPTPKGVVVYRPMEGEPAEWGRMEAQAEGYRNIRPIKRADEEGRVYDLTSAALEEMTFFPFGTHDDLVDAMSRVYDLDPVPPNIYEKAEFDPPVGTEDKIR